MVQALTVPAHRESCNCLCRWPTSLNWPCCVAVQFVHMLPSAAQPVANLLQTTMPVCCKAASSETDGECVCGLEPAATIAQAHRLRCRVRVTTRAMWIDKGRLLQDLHTVRIVHSKYAMRVCRLTAVAVCMQMERESWYTCLTASASASCQSQHLAHPPSSAQLGCLADTACCLAQHAGWQTVGRQSSAFRKPFCLPACSQCSPPAHAQAH